jgi:hypothetical protein
VQDIINETWTSWEKEYCAWLADAKWCIHQGENKRIEKFLPACKTLRLEGMKVGAEYCAIWEVSECDYDFSGFPLPVSSSLYTQELIAQTAEISPGVDVDRAQYPVMETVEVTSGVDPVDDELPGCCNCFGDGYVEDEFGFVKFCQCETEPKLSHQKTQRAIAQAAKNSPAVKLDRNPILTGITFSDRFLATYPPYFGEIHYKAEVTGQLNLLEPVTDDEPLDPDDFESLDAFREAIARWDREHPSIFDHCSDLPNSAHSDPLELSIDSFCEWAPCPADWYEPAEVMELPPVHKNSSTSDFFILTFGRWGDRFNRNNEPPDTGIFARLPKPKPPNFPPQSASWTQVGRKLDTSQSGIPKLSRNYPETIPKLLHRVAAGSSTQPARSPPGGDAMS